MRAGIRRGGAVGVRPLDGMGPGGADFPRPSPGRVQGRAGRVPISAHADRLLEVRREAGLL